MTPITLSRQQGSEHDHLTLPSPRSTLRHAWPVVLEAVVGPLALFYVVLVIMGFRSALVGALAWSYLALLRRIRRGERISTLLVLGTLLLTVRTVVAFVTGSAVVYFAQPMLMAVVASLVLVGSAIAGRPITQRFAHDFCPIDPLLLARPRVRRFFVRISLLWATMLLLNAGIVLWLLLSSSVRTFVVERTAVTWGLTAVAVFVSITRFVATMRSDGITVEWGRSRPPVAVLVRLD
ncbi:MAG TPA: VC0807 family protein [Acidimicrobiales bacterium]|nr:VC0807 family protein [Acidimicrobiales bacterium]